MRSARFPVSWLAMPAGEELLRRLAANEESSIRMVLALRPEQSAAFDAALTPRTRTLVRLGALVALDPPTASLRWAAELASCAGATDEEIVAVLRSVCAEVGVPPIVSAAPRLALAIDREVEE